MEKAGMVVIMTCRRIVRPGFDEGFIQVFGKPVIDAVENYFWRTEVPVKRKRRIFQANLFQVPRGAASLSEGNELRLTVADKISQGSLRIVGFLDELRDDLVRACCNIIGACVHAHVHVLQ